MTNEELMIIFEEYNQKHNDNLNGIGYGYKSVNGQLTDEMSIIFKVKEKLPKEFISDDKLLPSHIFVNDISIRTDVVESNIMALTCDPSFYNWQSAPPMNRSQFRPLKGGIELHRPPYGGTLGFIAIDNDTNSLVGITNNHVAIDDGAIASDRTYYKSIQNNKNINIYQPIGWHSSTSESIAVVKKYMPFRTYYSNYIDAAAISIKSGLTNSTISYLQAGLTGFTTLSFATTEELNNLLTTKPFLYSAGRTTGAKGEGSTKLRVSSIYNSSTICGYDLDGNKGCLFFSDMIEFVATSSTGSTIGELCDYPIYPGDSGSAVVADINGEKKIIGLAFAGSTQYAYISRIDRIASSLNISPWNGEDVNFSNVDNILEFTVNGLSSNVFINYNGKKYWQMGVITGTTYDYSITNNDIVSHTFNYKDKDGAYQSLNINANQTISNICMRSYDTSQTFITAHVNGICNI